MDGPEPIQFTGNLKDLFEVKVVSFFDSSWKSTVNNQPDLFLFMTTDPSIVLLSIDKEPDLFSNPLKILWFPVSLYSNEGLRSCLELGIDCVLAEARDPEVLASKIRGKIVTRSTETREHAQSHSMSTEKLGNSKNEQLLGKILNYLEQHNLHKEFSIEKMGNDLGMSRTKFFSKVKTLTGGSPSRLVMNFRLKKASQLLEVTDRSISDIAFEVGFSSTAYFTRCFKHSFGVNPSRFCSNKRSEIDQVRNLQLQT